MDLHPDIPAAAAHVRKMDELGIRYFDCARAYWDGRSEVAYGIGLDGVRKNVFLTTASHGLLKTDYVDLWQVPAA
jgi:aryl-alcohol dehydrogenase-like predicted oxidoreductase